MVIRTKEGLFINTDEWKIGQCIMITEEKKIGLFWCIVLALFFLPLIALYWLLPENKFYTYNIVNLKSNRKQTVTLSQKEQDKLGFAMMQDSEQVKPTKPTMPNYTYHY